MITVEEIEKDYRENIERAMEQLGHEMQDYPSNYGKAAYNVAIEVMEKQIPLKANKILRHRGGFEMMHCPNCDKNHQVDNRYNITEDYCPNCGKWLDSSFKNYCGNCGQKILQED